MKTSSDAEREEIRRLLPNSMPEEIMMERIDRCRDELGGGEFVLFKQESWCNAFDNDIGFLPEDEQTQKAAFCRCTACHAEWHSGWLEGGGFRLLEGEDGSVYPGIPEIGDGWLNVVEEQKTECPFCGEKVTAIRTSTLKNGRTYNVLFGELVNLGKYSAVIYWMLRRKLDKGAGSTYSAFPWAALVIGGKGFVYRFSHAAMGMFGRRAEGRIWFESPHMGEPIQQKYYAWGCCNNTCMGGYYSTDIPDMANTTGEKTGLAAYLSGGGEFPMAFLLRQKRWIGLEALAMAGWVYTIDHAIYQENEKGRPMGYYLKQAFNLRARKPKDMLGMTRDEVKTVGRAKWEWTTAATWRKCTGLTAGEFISLSKDYGMNTVQDAVEQLGAEGTRKADRYLQRQREKRHIDRRDGLLYYLDYLNMLRLNGGGDTPIERFPPNLRAAHDRAASAIQAKKDAKINIHYAEVRERWAGLEWSNGEICAMLPRCSSDLTAEGKTLHHCVGGYGDQHLSGRLIIFIRHARRPERSWYTLNIDTTGDKWREVQLHGYGNELAHGKQLTIPRQVREFVNRWEAEVLTREFQRVKKAERKKAKKETVA